MVNKSPSTSVLLTNKLPIKAGVWSSLIDSDSFPAVGGVFAQILEQLNIDTIRDITIKNGLVLQPIILLKFLIWVNVFGSLQLLRCSFQRTILHNLIIIATFGLSLKNVLNRNLSWNINLTFTED